MPATYRLSGAGALPAPNMPRDRRQVQGQGGRPFSGETLSRTAWIRVRHKLSLLQARPHIYSTAKPRLGRAHVQTGARP